MSLFLQLVGKSRGFVGSMLLKAIVNNPSLRSVWESCFKKMFYVKTPCVLVTVSLLLVSIKCKTNPLYHLGFVNRRPHHDHAPPAPFLSCPLVDKEEGESLKKKALRNKKKINSLIGFLTPVVNCFPQLLYELLLTC